MFLNTFAEAVFLYHVFLEWFQSMYLQLVDVVEAAPSGAPKTTGVAGTCKHEIDILLHLSVHI